MVTAKRVVGWTILTTIFGAIFVDEIIEKGWLVFLATIALLGAVALGAWLVA